MASGIASFFRSPFSISRPGCFPTSPRTESFSETIDPVSFGVASTSSIRTRSLGEIHRAGFCTRRVDALTGEVEDRAAFMEGLAASARRAGVVHCRVRGLEPESYTQERRSLDGISVMVSEALRLCTARRLGLDSSAEQRDHEVAYRPHDIQVPFRQLDDQHWLVLRMAPEPPLTRDPRCRRTGDWAGRAVRMIPDAFRTVALPRAACVSDDDDDSDIDDSDFEFELPTTSAVEDFFYEPECDDGLMFRLDL